LVIPDEMVSAVASVVVHVSVADCPALMTLGVTFSVTVGFGVGGVTVSVTNAVDVPPAPLAVAVYVVVVCAVTSDVPLGNAGFCTPVMLNPVAFAVVQVSFAVCPGVTGFGETLKLTAGGLGTPFTVTVAVDDAVPPGPVAIAV